MKQMILVKFPWPLLPSFALILFFAVFVGVLIITVTKTKQNVFEAASRLPLEDGGISDEGIKQ